MQDASKREIRKSVCPLDCPDTCALIVEVQDGRIVKVDGDKDNPVTKGAICNKVRHLPERTHHPDRLLYPLRRTGPKGSHQFERISWDEAYAEIVQRYRDIINTDGAEGILPYSFYGNMGLLNAEGMDRRFFHRLGASRLERTICNAAGSAGYQATMGANAGINPEETVHSRLIIVWGCNLVSTNMHQVMLANEARIRGATIVHIDVHRNRTSTWADWFVAVKPGSDAALALGIMHILFRDALVNRTFLENQTVGWKELEQQVRTYSPDVVSAITGVPVPDIERLAHLYGSTSPSFIRIGNGLQHHDNGGMIVRTIACLPALTKQWGVPGGGALKGNSWYAQLDTRVLQRPDLMPNQNARSINMNQLGDVLHDMDKPVKALFVYNSNPALVAPDQTRVRTGLLRDDLFTVVHDLFLTDTCRYADIVLPATSHFENLDLYKSYWHFYLQLQQPILDIQGECKSNFTVFQELAQAMGFEEDCFQGTEEDMIREVLNASDSPYLTGVTYEKLRDVGFARLQVDGASIADLALSNKLPTPSGRIELLAEGLADCGLPTLPTHLPLQEPEDFPLQYVPGPNHSFLNSTFGNVQSMQRLERTPVLFVHRLDADVRGIREGDKVRVFNYRGSCTLTASVGESVLPGVVVSQGLWWDDAKRTHESVNILTSQRLSDMGRGATFFSTRVDIERLDLE